AYFQKCDETYSNRILKEEYWSRIVKIFIEVIGKLCDNINDFFKKDNNSLYLKIVYEKVLFLVAFARKKKYYSILYIRELNFNNKLFIWDVEIVKREQSKYFHKMDKMIMKNSIRLNNTYIMHQILEDKLQETVNNITQVDSSELV
ncbi:9699_t:CDS:1, partial [Funneliformis mosseae]